MAWMDDWHRRQLAEYSVAEKEHTNNNFTFPGRGVGDIWLTAEARLAAEELEYEDDDEYEL
ncbi:hypothetical protein E4U09_000756 [Claviceps aff. purpurea]|uniref:Uncharacterized protein n=1 Tax=Claviceps aff. purpurea TaxID=1967640 RepID=A0A9P7QKH9_9HYPO|nr:hypothetical protein E4U09_000756 [Claviceps aff. purpurea]